MNAWVGLVRKDFKLTRTAFLIGLVLNVLMLMLVLYFGMRVEGSLLIYIPLLVAGGLHAFYLPVVLLMSLKSEGNRLHLWLHNPQSAVLLLLSKLVTGLVMMSISLIMLYVLGGLAIMPNFSLFETYWSDIVRAGGLAFIHLFLIGVSLGVWVIFLWALYHALKVHIGRWSWLGLLAALAIACGMSILFKATPLHSLLIQWGFLELSLPSIMEMEMIQAYVGEYVYGLLIAVGLFYLSAWIIDRRIEV